MMEGNIWQLLAGFVAAMGIPSAFGREDFQEGA